MIRLRSLLSLLWQNAIDPFRKPENRGIDSYEPKKKPANSPAKIRPRGPRR